MCVILSQIESSIARLLSRWFSAATHLKAPYHVSNCRELELEGRLSDSRVLGGDGDWSRAGICRLALRNRGPRFAGGDPRCRSSWCEPREAAPRGAPWCSWCRLFGRPARFRRHLLVPRMAVCSRYLGGSSASVKVVVLCRVIHSGSLGCLNISSSGAPLTRGMMGSS